MDCLAYAQRYLARYPKTVREMQRQLLKKGYTEEEVTTTLPILEQQGLLSDRAYAQAYLHSEVARKGKPLAITRQKLLMKGMDKTLLDELIEQQQEELNEGIQEKVTKEIARLRAKDKSDQEIIATLMRRGFSYTLIKKSMFD